MGMNRKGLSIISTLFYLALLSVIVLILIVTTKKHVSFFGDFFSKTSESSSAYNTCATYCLSSSPEDKCKYGNKEISCAIFTRIYSSTFILDESVFEEGSLTAFGVKKENLIDGIGDSNN